MALMALANAEDDMVLLYTEPSAAITNTFTLVESAARFSSFTVPFTSRVAEGVVVPIPTLPFDPMIMRALLEVLMVRGCPSMVPIKLAAESVPLLPVNDQLAMASAMLANFFHEPLLRIRKLLSAVR